MEEVQLHPGILHRQAEVGRRRLHLLGEQVEGLRRSMARVVREQEELVGVGRDTLVYRKMGRMLMQSTAGEIEEELGKETEDLEARLGGLGKRRRGARGEVRGVERELGAGLPPWSVYRKLVGIPTFFKIRYF